MIELTPEQWQAIGQQETPTVVEPNSKTPFVVVPKAEYDKSRTGGESEVEVAHALRLAWMRRMRLDEEEIAESLRDDPPISVAEEMKQVRALDTLHNITPSGEVLRKYAIQY